MLQLTEGNSTVQHAGEWSWWTVRGKEKLPPLTPPLSVLFCVFLGAVGLAGGFLSQPQSRISSTLELESTLLSWFKPPASLRPPPPLFQTSLGQSVLALTVVHYLPHQCALRGRCGAQRWTTKSSRNRATNRSTDFHSLKKRWQCAVDCFVEKRSGVCQLWGFEIHTKEKKKNTHNSAFATGSFLQINLLKESFAQCSWPWLTR